MPRSLTDRLVKAEARVKAIEDFIKVLRRNPYTYNHTLAFHDLRMGRKTPLEALFDAIKDIGGLKWERLWTTKIVEDEKEMPGTPSSFLHLRRLERAW